MKLHEDLNNHIEIWHDKEHYRYQQKITKAILKAVIDSKMGITVELPIELPRQSGKTTCIVDVVEFLLISHKKLFNRPLSIGIFAPQEEQATTDFDRLKMQFAEISPLGFSAKVDIELKNKNPIRFPSKWNSKTVRLYNGSEYFGEIYIFPITKSSNPESKTFDLIIIEESQEVDDIKMKNAVFPMGISTNAPRIYVGTAGTRLCAFKTQLDNNPRAIKILIDDVIKERRIMFDKTGDPTHLYYEKYYGHEISTYGLDSDYIQRQYKGKWIIGTGQFTTVEKLNELIEKGRGIIQRTDEPVYVGIDTAKIIDRTVVTIIQDNKDNPTHSDLCGWLSLKGDNYEDQFEAIKDYLSNFSNIRGIAIDATGQGDFMPDKFERHTAYNIIRVKFSLQSKDILYKGLSQVIHNKATTLPDVDNDDNKRFREEMINLEREYKSSYLSVHHPKDPKAHDDYADSWALAEFAKTEVIKNEPKLSFI